MTSPETVNTLSNPFALQWRKAYKLYESDTPRLASYQAPQGEPVPFIQSSINITGGQSVDTAEFPIFGDWTNTPINNKPIIIKIEGFVRGENYIKNRLALFNALTINSSDDDPSFLELPLWGRIPVVVTEWSLDEKANENGQCAFSLSFVRAGISDQKRVDAIETDKTTFEAVKEATAVASEQFEKALKKSVDSNTLASHFRGFTTSLLSIVGRVQGATSALNKLTNKCNSITSLIAQGIRAPKELAQALVSAVVGIASGVLEIKNSIEEVGSYFTVKNNAQNVLRMFLTAFNYSIEDEVITEAQLNTKTESENLYKTLAFTAAALLLPEIETTYQKQKELWAGFEKLESSLKKENTDLYAAIESVRIAASCALVSSNAQVELVKSIKTETPLISLALALGCSDEKLRQLNRVKNSFLIKGDVRYV
ncbi:MAG: hypothetical protein ACRC5H_10785 [Treponemataceae bacterium]